MNKWVKKSIKLANSRGYLDKLTNVYPINLALARDISLAEGERIKKAFRKKNCKELISVLLNLERFPVDDPYIGFFRKDRKALGRNPKTVRRIGQRLIKMGINEILIGVSRAKTPSRQAGQLFKKWTHKLRYPVLSKNDFLSYRKIALLEGGDKALKNFATEELGYTGQKGLDMVLRIGNKFVIGEAKLITTSGGTQDKSFRESMYFIKQKDRRNVIRIAILDGMVWLVSREAILKKKKPNLYETVVNLSKDEIVLSALLLKDLIKSLQGSKN